MTPTERFDVPEEIQQQLLRHVPGDPMPAAYIRLHEEAARKRLAVLERTFGLQIVSTDLVEDGLCDEMFVLLTIVKTKTHRSVELTWDTNNQDFLVCGRFASVALTDAELL